MIYDERIHPSVLGVAKRTKEAHLIKLIKEGKVSLQDTFYSIKS